MPLDVISHVLSGNPLDRAAHRRTDEAWIHAQLENPATKVAVLWDGKPLVTTDRDPKLVYLSAHEALALAGRNDRPLFLGSRPTPVDGADGYPSRDLLEPLI